jgi:5-methyltetrahydropteroyltriglutamate--homocysteine methyltransferase
MKRSEKSILTTQAGSLPRPSDLLALYRDQSEGRLADCAALSRRLSTAVGEMVRRQKQIGIAIPGDGEYGKLSTAGVDYTPWLKYIHPRLEGFSGTMPMLEAMVSKYIDGLHFGNFLQRRDFVRFSEFYTDPTGGHFGGDSAGGGGEIPICRGPVSYIGHDAVQRDIANLKAALAASEFEEGFITAVSPGVLERFPNEYYPTDEEFLYALADAMHEEYKAIVDSGLILQIDDPGMPDTWDQANPEPPLADYRRFAQIRVEALNHALRGLPEDRVRHHICWGSWHGPHTTDLPLKDVVDLLLTVKAGAYSIEAGNVRHEHEWKVWKEIKLPKDKILIPGVVSHATNVVEHPEVVAERIIRYATVVGRENVIAGTDCGLGGRVHPQIAWAKLESLARGAELATQELWA